MRHACISGALSSFLLASVSRSAARSSCSRHCDRLRLLGLSHQPTPDRPTGGSAHLTSCAAFNNCHVRWCCVYRTISSRKAPPVPGRAVRRKRSAHEKQMGLWFDCDSCDTCDDCISCITCSGCSWVVIPQGFVNDC